MTDLDDAIREALAEEDADFLAQLDREPQYPQMWLGVFKGPMGPPNIILLILALPIIGVAVWAATNFVNAQSVEAMLRWFALAALTVVGLLFIRFWYGLSIQFDRVIREVKRLELQVAHLASRKSG